MLFEYVIVQAGGRGSRLGELTKNKPKCLVPKGPLPLLFYLFTQMPDKKFIIIGDYQFAVLEKYLQVFAKVMYTTVKATQTGNCSGIGTAISYVPKGKSFMLVWSDLILPSSFSVKEYSENDYVGLVSNFPCRWSYVRNSFINICSLNYKGTKGVAGIFIFKSPASLAGVPDSGEFVEYLQSRKGHPLLPLQIKDIQEMGDTRAFEVASQNSYQCRPFNSIQEKNNVLVKTPLDIQGKELAKKERQWYKEAKKYAYPWIPEIVSYSPLRMKKIAGFCPYLLDPSAKEKKRIVRTIVGNLEQLHALQAKPADVFSLYHAYYGKTMQRLYQVKTLIPFADQPQIMIQGQLCNNIFFATADFKDLVINTLMETNFAFIHGDCTFSNTLISKNGKAYFIDPRGYFGYSSILGDPYYDWAKLYYSVVGNYDQFNSNNFSLNISSSNVCYHIKSSGWEGLEEYFFSLLPSGSAFRIKLIHAIIWLSLTTYCWSNYDAVCVAFYNGLFQLHLLLKETHLRKITVE